MKKFFLFAAAAAVMGAGAYLGLRSADTVEELDPTQLANLHALTDDEGSGLVVTCFCKYDGDSNKYICSVLGSSGYCGGDPCPNHDGNCR